VAGKPNIKVIRVSIGIVVSAGRILICRRRKNGSFGDYWEFPGGKCEAGETEEQCVRRELLEELAIAVTPLRALDPIEYEYPAARVRLHPFLCRHDSGEPVALCASEWQWVLPAGLREHQFPPANDALIELLAAAGFIDEAIDLGAREA
jgi:mutator protein MutT